MLAGGKRVSILREKDCGSRDFQCVSNPKHLSSAETPCISKDVSARRTMGSGKRQ